MRITDLVSTFPYCYLNDLLCMTFLRVENIPNHYGNWFSAPVSNLLRSSLSCFVSCMSTYRQKGTTKPICSLLLPLEFSPQWSGLYGESPELRRISLGIRPPRCQVNTRGRATFNNNTDPAPRVQSRMAGAGSLVLNSPAAMLEKCKTIVTGYIRYIIIHKMLGLELYLW